MRSARGNQHLTRLRAGAVLLVVPGLILLLLGQRHLVRAFGGGGLAN